MKTPLKKDNVLATTEKKLEKAVRYKELILDKLESCTELQTWLDNYLCVVDSLSAKKQKKIATHGVRTLSDLYELFRGETGEALWFDLGNLFALTHEFSHLNESNCHHLFGHVREMVKLSVGRVSAILNPEPVEATTVQPQKDTPGGEFELVYWTLSRNGGYDKRYMYFVGSNEDALTEARILAKVNRSECELYKNSELYARFDKDGDQSIL
jgi:hypothetical protein